MHWLVTLSILAILLLNAFASWRLIRSKDVAGLQQIAQLTVIWLIPVVGSIACLTLLSAAEADEERSLDRTAFVDNAHPDAASMEGTQVSNTYGDSGNIGGGNTDGAD